MPKGQAKRFPITKGLTDIAKDLKLIQKIEQHLIEDQSNNENDGQDDILKEQLKEIKMQKNLLKANQQKIQGIEPVNFDE